MKRREADENMVWPILRLKLALVPKEPGTSSINSVHGMYKYCTKSIYGLSSFLTIFFYHICSSRAYQTRLVIILYFFQLKPSSGTKTFSKVDKISQLPSLYEILGPLSPLVSILKQAKKEKKENPICNKHVGCPV